MIKVFIRTILIFFLSTSALGLDFYTINLPPFSTVQEDKLEGPFFEVANRICNFKNMKCNFRTAPWKRIMSGVKDGSYNACYVVGKNKKRESWMMFSSPVVTTEYGFFYIPKYNAPLSTVNNLNGATIIVHAQSNTHRQLLKLQKKNPSFKISVHNDVATALKMFAKKRFGKKTYLYGNKHIYRSIYKNQGVKNVSYTLADKEIFYRFGFSKKSVFKNDFKRFEDGLQVLKRSGELKKILKKYGVD